MIHVLCPRMRGNWIVGNQSSFSVSRIHSVVRSMNLFSSLSGNPLRGAPNPPTTKRRKTLGLCAACSDTVRCVPCAHCRPYSMPCYHALCPFPCPFLCMVASIRTSGMSVRHSICPFSACFYVRPYVCLSVCLSVCLPVCLGAYSVVGVVILATPQWSDPSLDCLDMLCTQNQYSWLVGSHSTSAAGGVSPCVRHSSIQNEAFSVDVTTSICNFYTSDSLCFSFCQ